MQINRIISKLEQLFHVELTRAAFLIGNHHEGELKIRRVNPTDVLVSMYVADSWPAMYCKYYPLGLKFLRETRAGTAGKRP